MVVWWSQVDATKEHWAAHGTILSECTGEVSPEPDDESTPVTRDDEQQQETPTDSAGRSKVPNQAMISKMAGSFKGKENGAVDHSAPKHKSKRTPLGQAVQQKPGAKRLTIAERAQQVCASHPLLLLVLLFLSEAFGPFLFP